MRPRRIQQLRAFTRARNTATKGEVLVTDPSITPAFYSLGDTARLLGVSVSTVRALLRSGELGSVRIGRRRLVSAVAIDAVTRQLLDASA
jgi:excisionase family DNA binding protein